MIKREQADICNGRPKVHPFHARQQVAMEIQLLHHTTERDGQGELNPNHPECSRRILVQVAQEVVIQKVYWHPIEDMLDEESIDRRLDDEPYKGDPGNQRYRQADRIQTFGGLVSIEHNPFNEYFPFKRLPL